MYIKIEDVKIERLNHKAAGYSSILLTHVPTGLVTKELLGNTDSYISEHILNKLLTDLNERVIYKELMNKLICIDI